MSTPRFHIDIELVNDGPAGSHVVAHCHGLLVAGLTEVLHTEIKPRLAHDSRVVLDLTDVTRLDSMGLGAIVSLAVSAKRAGCRFELINLGKQIRQLFAITNLFTLFEAAGDNTFRIL